MEPNTEYFFTALRAAEDALAAAPAAAAHLGEDVEAHVASLRNEVYGLGCFVGSRV